ncbi:hypothetical protein DUNSADRAFT_7157 [Dunaliella salina]|uniref:Encoded protein n=1 Tax=Dunaliella salina TaxID=3046 RepID=A0ABQ7GLX8_DUNSA|nr:hypothetical protein DUNSADRAFT_7157 [Dunaliella salina]|eukprot:KAF5835609.1 hypothetical protein DUNSADRAFT_7157 [Dunaliella salina]
MLCTKGLAFARSHGGVAYAHKLMLFRCQWSGQRCQALRSGPPPFCPWHLSLLHSRWHTRSWAHGEFIQRQSCTASMLEAQAGRAKRNWLPQLLSLQVSHQNTSRHWAPLEG